MGFKIDIDDQIKMFDRFHSSVYGLASAALYEGAGVVADAIRNATPQDSGDLADSIGIAEFDKDGDKVSTAIGFSGYDEKGVPNIVKARVLEHGRVDASGRTVAKHPFIKNAVRKAKQKALNAMQKRFEQGVNDITK